MVNATSQTTSTSALPPAMQMTSVPPVSQPAPNATHSSQPKSNGIDRMKKNMKYVLAGLFVFVLVAGGGAALFLSQQSQDVRQQASTTGCIEPPVARNPGVAMLNDTQFKLQWTQVPNADGYRIFLITQGQAGTDPSGKYIIFNILDNTNDVGETDQYKPIVSADARFLPPTQTDYTWTLPTSNITDLEGKVVNNRDYYRFLVFAFKNGVDCSSQAALGMYSKPASTPTPTTDPSMACSEPKPVIDNRTALWTSNNTQIDITWKPVSGKTADYEIWSIGYGTLETLGKDKYYLQKLTTEPLPAGATSYKVTNPSSLQTRRFLIRAVTERNAAGDLACYDEWALCAVPVVSNRTVTMPEKNTAVFSWKAVQKPQEKYEIWLISNGTLEDLGPAKYYIAKLADNIDPNVETATVTIPSQYQNQDTYRFLIRAVNYSEGTSQTQEVSRAEKASPSCYDQWALGLTGTGGNTTTNQCTMTFSVSEPSATPTPVPSSTVTPTLSPTPSSVPTIGCNDICVTNADCTNPDHICFVVSDTENRCRLESNPNDSSCQTPTTVTTPTQVADQPVLPETLPETGPEDWGNWLKAGLAILGIGAALLLML